MDRLLYRLGRSRHAREFYLKGGLLVANLLQTPHRFTRDIDFLQRSCSAQSTGTMPAGRMALTVVRGQTTTAVSPTLSVQLLDLMSAAPKGVHLPGESLETLRRRLTEVEAENQRLREGIEVLWKELSDPPVLPEKWPNITSG